MGGIPFSLTKRTAKEGEGRSYQQFFFEIESKRGDKPPVSATLRERERRAS